MSRAQAAFILAGIVCLFVASGPGRAQEARRYIAPRTAADAKLPPFSGAVEVGKTLYLSGDIGVDATTGSPTRRRPKPRCCSRTSSERSSRRDTRWTTS